MTGHDNESSSQSTLSSPRSQKASVASEVSRGSQSSLLDNHVKELTPLSSVDSDQDLTVSNINNSAAPSATADSGTFGKKRSADGQLKHLYQPNHSSVARHARNLSTLSHTSTGSIVELSESLKTKLSYALVKVQNGWQERSIDEIESLAPLSPRSARFGDHVSRTGDLSPRSRMASLQNRANADHSTSLPISFLTNDAPDRAQLTTNRKSLAPPATIVSSVDRRGANVGQLRVNTSKRSQDQRPSVQQRTPSQNAAMEADAVETLLFMSASPSSSNHFKSQQSPLTATFSPWTPITRAHPEPNRWQPLTSPELKSTITSQISQSYDSEHNSDLDQALSIVAAHKAAAMST